jgi:hypothetical protein
VRLRLEEPFRIFLAFIDADGKHLDAARTEFTLKSVEPGKRRLAVRAPARLHFNACADGFQPCAADYR